MKANAAGLKAYNMQKYKQSAELAIRMIERDYEKYRRTPEDHPMYKDEWIEFWGRRYKELKKEGRINPNDYDYKPEWIKFWTERMEDIFVESIEGKKRELRARFNLPRNFEVSTERKPATKRPRSPIKLVEYEEISSDDSGSPPRCRRRTSPHSSQPSSSYYDSQSTYKASRITQRPPFDDYVNEPVTFINVCRLMSALEPELGSLSPKVLELLSKALAIEKIKPNACDQALMTSENAVFLETVKEKMKGLLMVDVLPRNKVAAVKKCIKNIARLIHQTPIVEEEKKHEASERSRGDDDEKMKLAMEISEMLKAHGKEDCTSDELEVLVETFLERLDEQTQETEGMELKDNTKMNSHSSLNLLCDDDLKILLQNFSELDADEQNQLIEFLIQVEKQNPSKVAELRKYLEHDESIPNTNVNTNEGIMIDNDPDDYNIDEVINSVVSRTHGFKANGQPGTSLTDNLLSLNSYNRMFDNFQP